MKRAPVLLVSFVALVATAQKPQPKAPTTASRPLGRVAASADLFGQWEGRVEIVPGQGPKLPTERERATLDRGRRLLAATKLFVRLGPGGACKLASGIVNGPARTEVARWSLVGTLLKIERAPVPGQKARPALIGVVAPDARGLVPTRITLELPRGPGRANGRIVLVRTGYPAPATLPLTGAGA